MSSEIYLNLDSRTDTLQNGFELLTIEEINNVLSRWPELKILHVSNLDSISRRGINASSLEKIEKIIVAPKPGKHWPRFLESSKRYSNENHLNELIAPGKLELEKFWLDPKNIMSPIKFENVLGVHFELPGNQDELDAYLEKMRPFIPAIDTLSSRY